MPFRAPVIVTKDEDFAVRAQLSGGGPTVVWIRYGNVRRAELLVKFALVWPRIVEALDRGETGTPLSTPSMRRSMVDCDDGGGGVRLGFSGPSV